MLLRMFDHLEARLGSTIHTKDKFTKTVHMQKHVICCVAAQRGMTASKLTSMRLVHLTHDLTQTL